MATLTYRVAILLVSSRRSGCELGRVALPTVQRRLALSGKLCFNSLWPVTDVTGQGNGLRSRIVREKRGGPEITVEAKKNNNYKYETHITVMYPLTYPPKRASFTSTASIQAWPRTALAPAESEVEGPTCCDLEKAWNALSCHVSCSSRGGGSCVSCLGSLGFRV